MIFKRKKSEEILLASKDSEKVILTDRNVKYNACDNSGMMGKTGNNNSGSYAYNKERLKRNNYNRSKTVYRSYKTELDPTEAQIKTIEMYFRMCATAYNRYVEFNRDVETKNIPIVSPEGYFEAIHAGWVKDVGSEYLLMPRYKIAVERALKNAERAMFKFQSGEGNFPKLKNIQTNHISLYFRVSDGLKHFIPCERHRIYIPYIGWIRLKEKGYIPCVGSKMYIVSGWIKKKAGRYFVSAQVVVPESAQIKKDPGLIHKPKTAGIGIDLNVNNFAVVSDGRVFENINKTERVQKLKAKLNKCNRQYSRMQKMYDSIPDDQTQNYKKKNLQRMRCDIDKIYYRLECIRNDYLKKCVKTVVDTNPEYITVEDLKVKEMVTEHRFAKYIADQMFYRFKYCLTEKCKQNGIELRMADKYYPSSKLCHECGAYFEELDLGDRELICPKCGRRIYRDLNASLNLRDAKDYRLLT